MASLATLPPPNGQPPASEDYLAAQQDATADQNSEGYGENNINLPENLQNKLKDLCQKVNDEDKFSRRLEIQTSKRAHFYWRTLQHLVWDGRAEGWVALGPNGAPLMETTGRSNYNKDSAVLYCTNIYKPFGLTLIAVLTQNIPEVVAVPADGQDAADLATARAGNRIRKIIEHENDATMLLTEAMFFAYVDGRVHAWTRNEADPQTKKERPRITMHGSLEVKVPITAKCMDDFLYVQYSHEVNVAIAKYDNPTIRAKIKGGAQGAGQDVYERTARISVSQGTSYMSGSGDTLMNQATEQQTWLRPAAFENLRKDEEAEDPDITELQGLFPAGCRVKFYGGGVYAGSWNESMDDHWQVLNAEPGDGQFRNSLGHTTESVQERFNDIINIAQDTYEKTIPAGWQDSAMVDAEGIFRQQSKPGARYPVVKRPGEPIGENFYFEPPSTVSPDMLQYGNDLMGPVGQLTSGAFTALQGGGEAKGAAGDTASGYAMQRDQAMGRIGLVYRGIKRWWANIIGQAVKCAALLNADMSMNIPDESGRIETTSVRIEELKGNVHWYADTDDSYPISQAEQRATIMQLLTAADANPLLAKNLAKPGNQEVIARLIGVEGLELANADSWEKQMLEINEMLEGEPQPNPALDQLKQQLAGMMQNSASGGLHPDGAIEQLAMQLKSTPPMVSSVPIDPECDDNAAEWETVKDWLSSPDGLKAKAEKPTGFANVRFHGLAHKQAAQAEMAAAIPPSPPPHVPPHGAPPPHGAAPGAPPKVPPAPQAAAAA